MVRGWSTLATALALMAIALPARGSEPVAADRFSELTELTPRNVRDLLPLYPLPIARPADAGSSGGGICHEVLPRELPPDSPGGVDVRAQRSLHTPLEPVRFAAQEQWRAGSTHLLISYLLGADGAAQVRAPVRGDPAELTAWDPVARRLVWSVREPAPLWPGTLITAGGLLFYGNADGWFKALDARTGAVLWKYSLPGAICSAPFSYRGADGHQYVAVVSAGSGRAARLYTFSLPR